MSIHRIAAGLRSRIVMATGALLVVSASVTAVAEDTFNTQTLVNGTEVVFNGVGDAREMTGSVYLGALYLEHRSSNPDVVATSIWSKRISMRISADKVYGRRLGQMWRERIAINSDRKAVTFFGKEIMQFVDTFKDTFVKGDQVNIDLIPDQGILVSVNGTQIGKIRKPEIYEMLLRAWVGDKPPTAQFKIGVLGIGEDASAIALQQQFAALVPTAKRIAETRAWKRDELVSGG